MADVPAPHRERKDHSLRWLFTHLPNPTLRAFGLDCPTFVEARSPVVPLIETKAVVVDALLVGDDRSVWHLEFEMGPANLCALIEHHVAVVRAYPDCPVETVVFWGRPRSRQPVGCGKASLDAHHVFLAEMDGDAELRRLDGLARGGAALTSGDILKLAMLPWMHQERPMWDVLREAAPVAEGLEPEMRRGVVGAMGALAFGALEPAQRPFLLEVLWQMPVGQELFDLLRQEGRQEGRREGERQGAMRKAREDVLDAFLARFDRLPVSVQTAVAATDDLALLKEWHRLVIRAQDPQAADAVFAMRH